MLMLRPMIFTLTLAVENIFSDEIVGRSPITVTDERGAVLCEASVGWNRGPIFRGPLFYCCSL